MEPQGAGKREFIFFAGWRRDLRDILLLLDAMCAPGSEAVAYTRPLFSSTSAVSDTKYTP